ncbi:DegV family protein [Chloroflexota bacterium]
MSEKKIAIITDSSAYIPKSILDGLNVRVIPLWLLWDGDEFRDGIDIDPTEFYQRLRQTKTLPTSSQPTVAEFIEFYQKVAQDIDTVVSVLVSTKISGTIDNAQAAVEKLSDLDIRIVDSKNSSMGLGHVVLAAARAAADGKSVEEVIAAAEEMRDKINFIFVVDTLEYLHKGGRIGGAKRIMGTALRVKPLLEFRDGQIEPLEQVRTKHKAYARLIEIAAERLAGNRMAEATVADVDNPKDGDAVTQMIVDQFNPKIINRAEVSPVVGTHVGPGTIGLAFYNED